jgi:hypothetical protein
MAKITADSLMPLETYVKRRGDFRAQVLAHKKNRTVYLGEHVTLLFEDELTMRYQVHEMLRAEKIFDEEGIQDELDAYNPLIPDGSNWKATMLIEYPNLEERKLMLSKLIGIEDRVWVQAKDFSRVYALADEDVERQNEQKTAAVHFLRFELAPDMIKALSAGARLKIGVDHPHYLIVNDDLSEDVRKSLIGDLAP